MAVPGRTNILEPGPESVMGNLKPVSSPVPEMIVELSNTNGCRARFCALGATLMALEVPNRDGLAVDVVLGYDDSREYFNDPSYVGSVIGRYAGRIDQGVFKLGDRRYQLPINDGNHHLHGGHLGFHRRSWDMADCSGSHVEYRYTSPDGEQGYPGEITVTVRYTLAEDNALHIEFTATTRDTTIVNLTNHTYFNLDGHDAGDIRRHSLQVDSDTYVPLRKDLIPERTPACVTGTPFDFRAARLIGEALDASHPQLAMTAGFDHAWVLSGGSAQLTSPMARLSSSATGIAMALYSDQTSLQFYSGHNLPETWSGKGDARYGAQQGLCLETQHLPNSPNQPEFPDTTLAAGETFRSVTIFRFSNDAGTERVKSRSGTVSDA